ncbi:hypothetical protein PHYPSEUDO_015157 [Phytophthora pseudosyringae]|uniref:Uncharacterized protein n=1 Tax=Phytophthora pseudosyringae TaxID=221518 RepID=A0A8T1VZL8_9STRA|nr:hypothetical protein PHYPSEUDO_015157 [Phytophthora pseudosyringae]
MSCSKSHAAIAFGYSGSSSSSTSYSAPHNYGGNSTSSSDLHYTKGGSLNVRYKSKREAVARQTAAAAPSNTDLDHTKSEGVDPPTLQVLEQRRPEDGEDFPLTPPQGMGPKPSTTLAPLGQGGFGCPCKGPAEPASVRRQGPVCRGRACEVWQLPADP